MERHTTFTPGEHYHIYNRGIDKRKIFFSEGDWRYFQRLLFLRNDVENYLRPERCKNKLLGELERGEPLVDIQAYALMPNHFHLLLSERKPGGITTYMKRLLTSYAMYMNKKYDRSGPLMCRPFRSKHVHDDDYLRWVISYIHLNPIDLEFSDWEEKGVEDRGRASAFIRQYPYSSYCDYFDAARDEGVIINKQSLPIFINELEDINKMLQTCGLGAS